jgi:excisionase family DNA binding protein
MISGLAAYKAETTEPITRLSWRLDEASRATGLSVNFLRKEIEAGELRSIKRGRCVILLDSDLKEYLSASREN